MLRDPCWCLAGDSMPQIPAATLDALAFFAAAFSALRFCLRTFLLMRLRWAEVIRNSLASGSSDDVSPLRSRRGNSLVSVISGAGEGVGLLCGVMCVGGSTCWLDESKAIVSISAVSLDCMGEIVSCTFCSCVISATGAAAVGVSGSATSNASAAWD